MYQNISVCFKRSRRRLAFVYCYTNVIRDPGEHDAAPGDSLGITKYHSKQNVRCWKQWRTDELVDVLCPSGAYEKVFWWFLDVDQFVSN